MAMAIAMRCTVRATLSQRMRTWTGTGVLRARSSRLIPFRHASARFQRTSCIERCRFICFFSPVGPSVSFALDSASHSARVFFICFATSACVLTAGKLARASAALATFSTSSLFTFEM